MIVVTDNNDLAEAFPDKIIFGREFYESLYHWERVFVLFHEKAHQELGHLSNEAFECTSQLSCFEYCLQRYEEEHDCDVYSFNKLCKYLTQEAAYSIVEVFFNRLNREANADHPSDNDRLLRIYEEVYLRR